MNIHSRTHPHDRELLNTNLNQSSHDQSAKAGLWKLLVTAVVILLGLVFAVEYFGDGTSDFTAPATPETIVQ